MKPSEIEKGKMSRGTLKNFFSQFDLNDPHIRIVLETVFEDLYGIKDDDKVVHLSGKKGQDRHESSDNDPRPDLPSDTN